MPTSPQTPVSKLLQAMHLQRPRAMAHHCQSCLQREQAGHWPPIPLLSRELRKSTMTKAA